MIKKKCSYCGVNLMIVNYDEPLTSEMLEEKLVLLRANQQPRAIRQGPTISRKT